MFSNLLQQYFSTTHLYYSTVTGFDVVNYTNFKIPECVGQFVILHFLDISDTWRLRTVSKQFKTWAHNAIACREDIVFENQSTLSCDAFNHVISRITHLRRLNLDSCKILNLTIVSPGVGNAISKLSHLRIRNCQAFTDKALAGILEHCHALQELDSDLVSNTVVKVLVEYVPGLISLKATGSGKLLTDHGLQILSGAQVSLQNMNVLELGRCDISNDGLYHLAHEMGSKRNRDNLLKVLDVSNCPNVTATGVVKSLECIGCSLEQLIMRGLRCTDLLLTLVCKLAAKHLKALILGDCPELKSSSAISSFALSEAAQNIQTLELTGSMHINSDGFCRLVSHCNDLRKINLDNCRHIDDTLLEHLSFSCKKLSHISFKSCGEITDRGLITLVKGCPDVFYLNLASCGKLTDESIVHVGSHLKRLNQLDLFCCYSITDQGIESLALGCKELEMLNVSWCFKVTSSSLSEIIRNCHKFRSLFIEGCTHLPDFEVKNLIHMSRRLKVKGGGLKDASNLVKKSSKLKRAESDYSIKIHKEIPKSKDRKKSKDIFHQLSLVHSSSKPIFLPTNFLSASLPVRSQSLYNLQKSPRSQVADGLSQGFWNDHYVSLDELEKRAHRRRNSVGRRLWGDDLQDVERLKAFSLDDKSIKVPLSPNGTNSRSDDDTSLITDMCADIFHMEGVGG